MGKRRGRKIKKGKKTSKIRQKGKIRLYRPKEKVSGKKRENYKGKEGGNRRKVNEK